MFLLLLRFLGFLISEMGILARASVNFIIIIIIISIYGPSTVCSKFIDNVMQTFPYSLQL